MKLEVTSMGSYSAAPPAERERAELESVLGSERFSRSPRLAKLLVYLCHKYFEGEADQIKEYNIATEVLGRPPGFDPSQDAIARVEAHRLRKKLKDYYATEGSNHPVKIVLSPGTYVPVFAHAARRVAALSPSPTEQEIEEPAVLDALQAPPPKRPKSVQAIPALPSRPRGRIPPRWIVKIGSPSTSGGYFWQLRPASGL